MSRVIKVKTYRWDRFGNNITEGIDALCELVHNAYSASLTRRNTQRRVEVSLRRRKSGGYILKVLNNGEAVDFFKLLNYGCDVDENGSALNQFGTGFKTAASFFNPSNDGWAVYSKTPSAVISVNAPYCSQMPVHYSKTWKFADWADTCIEIFISDESKIAGIDKEALGFRYAPAIQKGLNLYFGKELVEPVLPKQSKKCVLSDRGIKTSIDAIEETETININDVNVKMEYKIYTIDKASEGRRFYGVGLDHQGVYVFVNNCFAEKTGVSLIKKSLGSGCLKEHPSLNEKIAVVNFVIPNHKADLPFVNCKNAINWRKAAARPYRKAIDESLIGKVIRETSYRKKESLYRHWFDENMNRLCKGSCYYFGDAKISKELAPNAIICREVDKKGDPVLSTITRVIEFTSGCIKPKDIGRVLAYYATARKMSPDVGITIIAADENEECLTDATKNFISMLRSMNIDVEFSPLPYIDKI